MFIVQVTIQMNVSDPKPESSFMQYLAFTIDNTVLYTVVYCTVTWTSINDPVNVLLVCQYNELYKIHFRHSLVYIKYSGLLSLTSRLFL